MRHLGRTRNPRFILNVLLLVASLGCATEAQVAIETRVGFDFDSTQLGEASGRINDIDGSDSYIDVTLVENGGSFSMYRPQDDLVSPAAFVIFRLDEPSWLRMDMTASSVPDWSVADVQPIPVLKPFNNIPRTGQYFIPPARDFEVPSFDVSLVSQCFFIAVECPFSDQEETSKFSYVVEQIPDPLPGDLNLDDKVAFDDFLTLASNLGTFSDSQVYAWGDLNFDYRVNFDDFLILQSGFGQSRDPVLGVALVQSASVPEPSGVFLVLVAGGGGVTFVQTRTRNCRKKLATRRL